MRYKIFYIGFYFYGGKYGIKWRLSKFTRWTKTTNTV